jgi:hypothetical protein
MSAAWAGAREGVPDAHARENGSWMLFALYACDRKETCASVDQEVVVVVVVVHVIGIAM